MIFIRHINPEKTRDLVFDGDGTIWYSFKPTLRNYRRTVEAMKESGETRYLGLSVDEETCRRAYRKGLPTGVFIAEAIPVLKSIPNGVEEFNAWYRRVNPSTIYPVFDGVMEMLKDLKEGRLGRSYILGFLSGSPRENIERRTKNNGFDMSIFHFALFGEDVEAIVHVKSDPRIFDPVETELKKLGLTIEETAYVGDTIAELGGCHKRGIPFVAVVGDGHTTREEFAAEGLEEKFILETPVELTKILGVQPS